VDTDPIEQFEIHRLIALEIAGVDASITNSALWMMIVVAAVSLFMVLGMRRASAVPGRMQSAVEMFYEFVAGMVRDNVGNEGRPYFPFIFTLFMFVLVCNLLGMIAIPGVLHTFTVTSHIVVTFALAIFIAYGHVDWLAGAVLAVGNTLGAPIGAKLALAKGNRLIFGFVLVVMIATGVKLLVG